MESHTFNKTILREYDIRGIIEKDLNLIDALFLGKSFATLLKRNKLKNVVIGYDGRISSLKIEKELIEGNMKVKEIPKVWNMFIKKYLGIEPKNNKDGCLQDIHWFDGTFGYFPTYTLGALYAAQFFAKAKEQIPSLSNQISKGRFTKLLEWLRDNIHQKGSLYTSDELIKKVTGEELNIEYFKKHLINRYLN